MDDLLASAARETGLDNWGDPGFRDGLDALVENIGGLTGLTPLGALTFRNMIAQMLTNRLRFVFRSEEHSRLEPPVIITGLPRSGTTLLHRLLSLDPAHYSPPLWELLDPFAESSAGYRRFRSRLQIAFKNRLLPELDRKHFTRADTPEECTLLLGNSFSSPLFSDMAPMEGYLEWYQSSARETVYTEYRTQLEILQSLHPGRRLVLKAPAHLGNLADLVRAVPETILLQTHRDPSECFLSQCSLRETLAQFVIDRPDRDVISRLVERTFDHDLSRCLDFLEEHDHRVTHVAYTQLCAEPVEVVRQIYRDLGLGWSSEIERSAEDYNARFPKHRFGGHGYVDSDWGVSRERVNGMFGEYRKRFSSVLATEQTAESG